MFNIDLTGMQISGHFFVYFADRLFNSKVEDEWYNQVDEKVSNSGEVLADMMEKQKAVIEDPKGKELIAKCYDYFSKIINGKHKEIEFAQKSKPIFIIGMPRTGGTYVTKQAFKALGMDYKKMTFSLAHDAFPSVKPNPYQMDINEYLRTCLDIACFIVMAEYEYTTKDNPFPTFPKKSCNMLYHLGLFSHIFPRAEYIFTHRDVGGIYGSIMDKRGSYKELDKKFNVSIVIDQFITELLISKNINNKAIFNSDYYSVFYEYYKHYHMTLLSSGLLNLKNLTWVNFNAIMGDQVEKLFKKYDKDFVAEKFIYNGSNKYDAKMEEHNKKLMRTLDLIYRKNKYKVDFY